MCLMGFPPLWSLAAAEKKKRSGLPEAVSCQQKPEIAYATMFGLRGSPSTESVVADFSISPSGAVCFRDYGV